MESYQKKYLVFLVTFIPFAIWFATCFPFNISIGNTTYIFYLVNTNEWWGWIIAGTICGVDVQIIYEVFK